jgi:3',5'-cyclic AMP phosphodiesterase CpdA
MMGNHDDRAAFPDAPMQGGFAQSAVDFPTGHVILADTLEPGDVEGRLCDARLAWLDAALEGARNALPFLHHPPFAIGIPSLDDSRLIDADRLRTVVARHGNVRHIFAGHVHRFATDSWAGIPFTTMRGTNHQSALRFFGPHEVSFEPPAYAVILMDGHDVVVHPHEFPCRN